MKYLIKNGNKIHKLIEKTCKTPFNGIEQPEPLNANYSGYWFRRINLEHIIIYKVEDEQIVVFSIYGHYQD